MTTKEPVAVELCNGDKTLGNDYNAKCFASGDCGIGGCDECTIICPGCVNCAPKKLYRDLEVGDYVYVEKKVASTKLLKWTKAMDKAIGRVAWIHTGDPLKGFTLKFSPEIKTLEKLLWSTDSLRLATSEDVAVSGFIASIRDNK